MFVVFVTNSNNFDVLVISIKNVLIIKGKTMGFPIAITSP